MVSKPKLTFLQLNNSMKNCPKCQTIHSKPGIFCSRTCANSRGPRTEEFKTKTRAKLLKTYKEQGKTIHYKEIIGPYTKVYQSKCKVSGLLFYTTKVNIRIHPSLKLSARQYRSRCKFSFSIADAPHLFDESKIQSIGWYSPTNSNNPNLNGLTWDHLYRIEDGFKNNIDPSIMKHPANAELLTWRENIKRSKSQITYEELISRIEAWNGGPIGD